MSFELRTALVKEAGMEALVIGNNVAARALRQSGMALHNAFVGDEMLRVSATTSRVDGPSHIPALSFDGAPTTGAQAEEVAQKMAKAVTAHLDDGDVAHNGLDTKTPRVKTPNPGQPGGSPKTFAGADPDGGLVIVAAKPGVTYSAVVGAALKVDVMGNDIVSTIAAATTANEEAIELAKVAGGLIVSALPTGTGKGVRAASGKTAMPYGDTMQIRNARLNELKAIVNAHAAERAPHNPMGAVVSVKAPDATDDKSSIALAADLVAIWTWHVTSAAIVISVEGF